MLKNKKILIGITGGIAAYKVCSLIRELKKLNADVKTILTPNAKNFVTETTLMTLSQNPVYSDEFSSQNWRPEHISLSEADLFIIAPASANTIGKIANGICDNLLTSTAAAFSNPIIITPAMNCNMWSNHLIQKNIETLKSQKNITVIPPSSGYLACGYDGNGRMAEPEDIKNTAISILTGDKFLNGKKIIVTAGGTKEQIDPVRFIGNHSSGKMGIAIADAACRHGADVTLIATFDTKKPYRTIVAASTQDMLSEVKQAFMNADALIMAAAPADFRVEKINEQKIKKEDTDELVLKLIKNPDILKEISNIKKNNQLVIGFCAESENLVENAKKKIKSKNLDFIVANDISSKEIGFNSDLNEVKIIDKSNNIKFFQKDTKNNIAEKILEEIFKNAQN